MISIVNEDCLIGCNKIKDSSVDLICTDPPYNLKKDYGNNSDNQGWKSYHAWTILWMNEAKRILKPTGSIYVFMGYQFISDLFILMRERFIFNSWITWAFTQGVGKTKGFSPRHEDILFFTKTKDFRFFLSQIRVPQKANRTINNPLGANPGDVWSVPHVHWNKPERVDFPTQKPIEVIKRVIAASSCAGDLVVDLFSGSGTTAAACEQMNRNFIGFEISEKSHQLSLTRIGKK